MMQLSASLYILSGGLFGTTIRELSVPVFGRVLLVLGISFWHSFRSWVLLWLLYSNEIILAHMEAQQLPKVTGI